MARIVSDNHEHASCRSAVFNAMLYMVAISLFAVSTVQAKTILDPYNVSIKASMLIDYPGKSQAEMRKGFSGVYLDDLFDIRGSSSKRTWKRGRSQPTTIELRGNGDIVIKIAEYRHQTPDGSFWYGKTRKTIRGSNWNILLFTQDRTHGVIAYEYQGRTVYFGPMEAFVNNLGDWVMRADDHLLVRQ